MTDAWEPANQLEQQLREVLSNGDQDAYFALVRDAGLLVPLPPEEAESILANQAAFTWPTNTREGRTHVLAYTSREAARACLGPGYEHFVRMSFTDMARSWPNQEWWLAVNAGLPIEGYLPAWFIGRLIGAAPAQQETATGAAPAAQGAIPGAAPAEYETMPGGVVPPIRDAALVPPAADGLYPPSPENLASRPGEHAAGLVTADASFPPPAEGQTPQPVPEGIPGQPISDPSFPPSVPPPAQPVDEEEAAEVTVREGEPAGRPAGLEDVPVTLHITENAEFAPLDDEERALHDAAVHGDRVGFLRTLLHVQQIWVPMVDGNDSMLGPGRPGFQWYTQESDGRTVVPLFTGPSRMREAMGGHPFVLSDLAKVLRFWPDPSYDLVVNGGSPIGATIPGDRITAMSEQVDGEAAARLARAFPAQSDAERQLFDARSDPDMLIKILLDTSVFLPVWSRTPPTVQTPPSDPAFPWSAVPVRGRASVLVFTSFDWMKTAVGTTGFVMPTFADLLTAWPEPGWSVSVNPGTPIEVSLSGEQIRTIADTLRDRAPARTAAARQPEAAAPGGPAAPSGAWAIMQKVVPHDQVGWYLERAYDRVAGFVHRVQDVAALTTPQRLYETLGLSYEGSPFAPDDERVHVIRWPAFRPAAYRTPFGGGSEEALASWGQGGWVLEGPPFKGDGFAPGSGGTIPEYKVDSIRLPHGAEMYVVGRDGSERFVARYDADRLVWEKGAQ